MEFTGLNPNSTVEIKFSYEIKENINSESKMKILTRYSINKLVLLLPLLLKDTARLLRKENCVIMMLYTLYKVIIRFFSLIYYLYNIIYRVLYPQTHIIIVNTTSCIFLGPFYDIEILSSYKKFCG